MFKSVKGIYRDENATELNGMLKELLDYLKIENEEINDYLMELTLIHEAQREKTFQELLETPQEFHEIITLNEKSSFLSEVIHKLEEILYSGFEEVPLTVDSCKKSVEPYMRGIDALEWLAMNVKPLILDGVEKQSEISRSLSINQSTISNRVKTATKSNWEMYVTKVKKGIY